MKKTKINPYLKHLFKENLGYIGVLAGLLILTVILAFVLSGKITENSAQIKKLEKEVVELQDKQNLLTTTASEGTTNLEEDIRIIQALIPDAEDYFSILYALDQLSQKTGFLINSYTINLTQSTKDKLSVVVTGVGDADSFLRFLQEYNFGGGRLITTEKIELGSDQSEAFKLNLTFYNRKVVGQNTKRLDYKRALENFKKIKSKVTFDFLPQSTPDTTGGSYPVESNPF